MTPGFFYFLLIAVLIAGAGTAGWYFVERARQYGRVSGSLQSVLYVILLPQESVMSEQERRDPKDIISVMEQFYAGLSSREEILTLGFLTDRPSFALEIALPSMGEETTFYAAMPRKWSRVFERKKFERNQQNRFVARGGHEHHWRTCHRFQEKTKR